MKKTKKECDDTMIDGAFTVSKQRWGTFVSHNSAGTALVTSLTEETCIEATRCVLKWQQEGFTAPTVTYDGVVGGKL